MPVLQVRKFNLDLTGVASSNSVTDELYTNVGSSAAFSLGHSRFAGSTLNIYTGAGSTGYHLVLSTDYSLGSQDSSLSGRSGFAVYATVSITNPTYQSGNLYISYHVIADIVNANDQYNIALVPGLQYVEQNNDGSISVIADVITLGNVNTTTLTIGTQTIWDSTIGLHLQTASTLVLGAVKVDGTTITINGSGVISSSPGVSLVTAGSSTVGAVQYNGLTQAAGQFDGGSTNPIHTTRLDYDGYLHATGFFGDASSLSGIIGNYISNGTYERGAVTDWATYANTAQSYPVNGTGGTPDVTFTINSTNPISGNYDAILTKDAVNRQGQGVSSDFTLNNAGQNTTLKIAINYITSVNYVDGDLAIFLYDKTSGSLLGGGPLFVPGISIPSSTSMQYFISTIPFDQNTGDSAWRVIFHITSTNANAWTFEVDNISLSWSNNQISGFGTNIALTAPISENIPFGMANSLASNNIAIGQSILQALTSGSNNIAIGSSSLIDITTGSNNVSIGEGSLILITTSASNNVAIGIGAGSSIISGSNDIIIGYNAQASSTSVSDEITFGNSSITTLRIGTTTIWDSTAGLHVPTATTLVLGVVKPDGTTIDINGSGVISVPTATTLALGLVEPDGTTIDINGSGVISVPTATSSLLGLVKPDGTIITVTAGAITVATATTLAFGVVKPDGTTITISAGVISAVASSVVLVRAGSSTIGAVQYNGTTQFTGMFDGGAIAPIHTIELNYDGNLYVNSLISTIDSAIHGLTIGTGPNGGTTNTAFGISSLTANTGGDNDTAIGYHALLGNTSGSWNTGIGASVLVTNSVGSNNTAFGYNSLNSTTGSQNLGIGSSAGSTLTTGSNNILIGYNVQPSIITVSNEVDIGNASIITLNIAGNTIWTASTGLTGTASFSSDITVHSLTIGLGSGANTSNIVLGTLALVANTSGSSNLAIGFETLQHNTSGSNNVALGFQALQTVITGSNNTGIGYLALQNTTGSNNTALGYDAGGNLTSGSDVICIGYNAQPSSGTVSNEVTIGGTGIQTFRIGTTTIWTASGGLQVSTATSSTLGVVEPDNITITINGSGVITAVSGYVLPVATTSSLGGVIPDGSSIAVSPTGVISIDSFFLDNFCKNSDFSSGLITGWIYSGCLTLSVTSVDPLSGTYSGLISSNEPIGTGGYVAYPFTIPLGLINSLLEINYSFQGGTNFNPLIPLSLQMFDVTNNVYLSGSFPCLAGIGTNSAIFLTNSNSTSYQLRFVYSIPLSDLVALVITPGNTVIQAFTNFSQFNTWTYMIDEISILPSRNQLLFNGPSQTAGTFDISNNIPISTKRLNLNADLYVTDLIVTGNVFAAAVYNAVWNDLAEFMSKAVNDNAEPGDVLVQTDKGLMKSSNKSDKAVVGVYSDSYGFALGASDQSSKYPVGLAGVVRVKVREPLEIGDLLISDVDGYATKIIEPTFGLVIGKVLENKIDYETSRIKMLVFTK